MSKSSIRLFTPQMHTWVRRWSDTLHLKKPFLGPVTQQFVRDLAPLPDFSIKHQLTAVQGIGDFIHGEVDKHDPDYFQYKIRIRDNGEVCETFHMDTYIEADITQQKFLADFIAHAMSQTADSYYYKTFSLIEHVRIPAKLVTAFSDFLDTTTFVLSFSQLLGWLMPTIFIAHIPFLWLLAASAVVGLYTGVRKYHRLVRLEDEMRAQFLSLAFEYISLRARNACLKNEINELTKALQEKFLLIAQGPLRLPLRLDNQQPDEGGDSDEELSVPPSDLTDTLPPSQPSVTFTAVTPSVDADDDDLVSEPELRVEGELRGFNPRECNLIGTLYQRYSTDKCAHDVYDEIIDIALHELSKYNYTEEIFYDKIQTKSTFQDTGDILKKLTIFIFLSADLIVGFIRMHDLSAFSAMITTPFIVSVLAMVAASVLAIGIMYYYQSSQRALCAADQQRLRREVYALQTACDEKDLHLNWIWSRVQKRYERYEPEEAKILIPEDTRTFGEEKLTRLRNFVFHDSPLPLRCPTPAPVLEEEDVLAAAVPS